MTDDPIRTFKLDTKIPTSGMLDVHRHGDVFHPFKICTLELLSCDFVDTSQPLVTLWDGMLDMYPRRVVPRLRLDRFELFCSFDNRVNVEFAVPKFMTVLLPDRSRLPFIVVFMNRDGCVQDKILEITPGKVGSDGQD